MDRMRKVSFVWGFVVILLFASLATIGFTYKYKSKKYKDLEKELVEITKKYTATDFKYPKDKKITVVTFEELKEKELIDKLEVNKNKCNGYVEVSFDKVAKYKAYIDCGSYKTRNFDKSKIEK